jgi:hypothetical protein
MQKTIPSQTAPVTYIVANQQYVQTNATPHAGYCCSLLCNCGLLCCVEIYPHCKMSPVVCCSQYISNFALCTCLCMEINRFAGNGIFTKDQLLNNLELQEAVFGQSQLSRLCPCCCLSRGQNSKFFGAIEAKNLHVIPIVCCYQIYGYQFYK